MSADISFPGMDMAALESRFAADEANITALQNWSMGIKTLQQLGTATVGETLILGLSLGVKRYNVTMTGAAVGDRLMVSLTGAPSNGTIQDAYVSAANTVSIGLLVPALALGAVIAVPIAVYKVI